MIAPDFIGFGRSDKFSKRGEYTFGMHRDTLLKFIDELKLDQITIVVQDWGGLIGLRVVSMVPERFARLVIMNTGLPTGEEKMPLAFQLWRWFVKVVPSLPVGRILKWGTVQPMAAEVTAAYEAPFPGRKYKAGAKAWPLLVPVRPDFEAAPEMKRTRSVPSEWNKPALVLFSDKDPVTRGGDRFFRQLIPTAREQPEYVVLGAGHFLQEDKGEHIAQKIIDFVKGNQ